MLEKTNQARAHATINIVSAPCGAGKSYALCQYIKQFQQNKNHLIVLPSRILIDQFYTDLKSAGLTMVDKISSDNSKKGQVKSDITDYFCTCMEFGHVLIITWEAYNDLPYFQNKNNWDIFIDELPQTDSFYTVNISKNKQFVTDFIELKRIINSEIAEVSIKENCKNKLQQAHDSSDDGYQAFKPLYRALLSENKDVFVGIDEWNAVTSNSKKSDWSGVVNFVGMLNPKQLENTTLLSANIEKSILYKWFSQFHKVKFRPSHNLNNKLLYEKHSALTGKRCELHYLLEDKPYSKYCRDLALDDDNTVGQKMDEIAVTLFGNADFLYVVNNDYSANSLSRHKHSTQLPVKPHGLNDYQHHTMIYFNLALNHPSNQMALLNKLGITREDVLIANTFETIYQCVMRTAIRNIDSIETIKIVVPDALTASYVSGLLGGGAVKKLSGIELPTKYPALTPAQRNKRSQFKKIRTNMFTARNDSTNEKNIVLFNKRHKKLQIFTHKENSNDFCSLEDMDNNKQMAVTFHCNYKNQQEDQFSDFIFDRKRLIRLLKYFATTDFDNKNETVMINSAVFDGSIDTGGYRRKRNFIQSHMMILDFDNGELTPEQFEAIFWSKKNKLQRSSFVICNSFSRSEDKPNCFRVFMFYKTPATSIKQHEMVFDDVVTILERHGYDSKVSGLDKVCRTGVQSFYVPGTNRAQQPYSFFRKHGLNRDEILRYGLDVELISRTYVPAETVTKYVNVTVLASDIEQEVSRIVNSIKSMSCNRHKPFFDAAIELRGLGLNLVEIEEKCYEIAGSEEKMQKKVPNIMASLKKYAA
jgi:type III restriction/modification enzyme restriction subunit